MSRTAASFTQADIARAIRAARQAWGDEARVIVNADRSIIIERGQPAQSTGQKQDLANVRPFRL